MVKAHGMGWWKKRDMGHFTLIEILTTNIILAYVMTDSKILKNIKISAFTFENNWTPIDNVEKQRFFDLFSFMKLLTVSESIWYVCVALFLEPFIIKFSDKYWRLLPHKKKVCGRLYVNTNTKNDYKGINYYLFVSV